MSVGCMVVLRAAPAAALQLARPRTSLRFTKPITSRAKPPESENDQPPAWKRLLLLLLTSPGQVRSELDASSVRTWTEAMMLPSHAAFVPGIAIAVAQSPPLPELALLQSSVLALSLAYHRNFERTGALAHAEGEAARRTKKLLGLHASAHDGARIVELRYARVETSNTHGAGCTLAAAVAAALAKQVHAGRPIDTLSAVQEAREYLSTVFKASAQCAADCR